MASRAQRLSSPQLFGDLLPSSRPLPPRLAHRPVYTAGDPGLLERPCVAIVGSRQADHPALALAGSLSAALVRAGCVVVSGLARGVDVAAHQGAIAAGGQTLAVLGTPIERAYPPQHLGLQDELARDHLLLSPFEAGSPIRRGNFPQRNRWMAAASDATLIVAAGPRSGVRHQVAACQALGRPVLVPRALLEAGLPWLSPAAGRPGPFAFDGSAELLLLLASLGVLR